MSPFSTGYALRIRAGDVILPDTGDFSLPETLDCGQAFRWKCLPDGSFFGVVRAKPCHIAQTGGEIRILGGADNFEAVWRDYFDLDRDYGEVKRRLSFDPILARAVAYAPGIRVLRQEPWEALCSFIISQNNNVPRIKGIVERLCAAFGEPLGEGVNAFPGPEALAVLEPDDLSPIRAGFRARYLVDAAKKVASGEVDLAALGTMELSAARGELRRITGVGVKVAECALLYGCGRVECMPVDVWVRRVLDQLYPGGLPGCARGIEGLAQQYLFHAARTCPGFLPCECFQSSDGR